MKKIKAFCAILSICSLLTATSACSILPHKHSWSNFIVKQPTCTEKGLLEKLCEECGEKEYEDINPSGHNYQNGACTICGTFGYADHEVEPIPMPENANNTAALSWEKLYNIKQTIYYEDNFTVHQFLNSLSDGSLLNIYIDNLGLFHATASFINHEQKHLEIPIVWSISKVSPTNPKASKFGNVSIIKVQNDQLTATYSDGVQVTLGYLQNNTVTITAFGLNPDNEFVVYYSNNTVAFAGKTSVGKPSETQADYIYRAVNDGYELMWALDYNASKVFKIPVSHQGKPIVSIANHAFSDVANIATSIIIPTTVAYIAPSAFAELSSNTTLYFEESRANCNFNAFTSARTYFKGEWSYINGVPTPNN